MNKRAVNKKLLEDWLDKHQPNGVARLAVKAHVSVSLIAHFRSNLKAPTKYITQNAICKVVGCTIDELFPLEETCKS